MKECWHGDPCLCSDMPDDAYVPRMPIDQGLARRLRTAGQKVAEWTAERDRLVKEAVAGGGSYREVGAACGLSHTAVRFIAHGRPDRG